MKTFTKFLSLAILGTLTACTDTALSPTATALMNDHQAHQTHATSEQKDSYFYLLGIGADGEPSKLGKAYHDELQAILANQGNQDDKISQLNAKYDLDALSHKSIQDELKQNNPNNDFDIFCQFTAKDDFIKDCFDTLIAQSSQIDITPYQEIHHRYQTFLKNAPSVTITTPIHNSHLPNYQILMAGQRLNLIGHLKNKNPNHTISELNHELNLLRHHLRYADTLIEKMIFTNMMARQLQGMVFLKQKYPNIKTPIITPLNDKELSLKDPILYEFMVSHRLYDDLAFSDFGLIDKIKMTLMYDKTDTINQSAEYHHHVIEIDKLSAPNFANHIINHTDTQPKINWKNYVGSVLANTTKPDYVIYSYRLKSLDNLINIANHQLNGTPLTNVFSPVVNDVIKDDQKICLSSPMTGKKLQDTEMECLNL